MVATLNIVKPPRLKEADARGEAVALRIAAGSCERRGADIRGGRLGPGECSEEREGDGAGARAEIQDAERAIAWGDPGSERERHAHDRLRIRTGIKRVCSEAECKTIECPLTYDARDGFTGSAARNHASEPVSCVCIEWPLRCAEQSGTLDT